MLINGKSVKWSAPLVFVLLICNIVYAEEPQVTESSLITLEECVRYALTNNPKLKEAAGNVDFNRAMVGVSKSAYLPQASTTGGYKHNDSSKTTFASTVQGTSAGSISALAKRSNTVSENTGVEQLIWDFGKTLNQIKLADENLTTAQYAFLEMQEETIFNAKKAYFDALKAQLLVDAAKENLEQSKVHLERAEGFYEVGFKQRFDVTKAEVAVSNAKLDYITAKKNYESAKASLNKITGKAEGRNYKVEEVKDFKTEDADLSEALKAAMKNRPELLRCQSAARAAQVDLDAKKKGNWPRISTSAAHQVSDTDIKGDDTTRSWNAGVAVKWPWFDGFKTRSEIEAAQANLKIAQASIQDETLNIALEVENAVLSLEESKERIGTTEKFLQEATENLEIANARYEEDLGSTIEVTDAETYLVSAKKSHASAIADYLSSVADYQKSIGVISQGMKNF